MVASHLRELPECICANTLYDQHKSQRCEPIAPPGRDCAELSPRQTAQEQEEAKPIQCIEARFSFAAILTSPPEGL